MIAQNNSSIDTDDNSATKNAICKYHLIATKFFHFNTAKIHVVWGGAVSILMVLSAMAMIISAIICLKQRRCRAHSLIIISMQVECVKSYNACGIMIPPSYAANMNANDTKNEVSDAL